MPAMPAAPLQQACGASLGLRSDMAVLLVGPIGRGMTRRAALQAASAVRVVGAGPVHASALSPGCQGVGVELALVQQHGRVGARLAGAAPSCT